MTDPAEIRADGRRLLADLAAARETIDGDRVEDVKEAWVNFTYQHHDVLLADPAPVGLSEDEREAMAKAERMIANRWRNSTVLMDLLRTIHRLSAAPVDDRERVPEGWRVEWHEIEPGHENCVLCIRWSKVPTLVPVSPSVDPEEG